MPKYEAVKTVAYRVTIEAESIEEAQTLSNNLDLRQGSETWGDTYVSYLGPHPCSHPKTRPFQDERGLLHCTVCDLLLRKP